MKRQIDIDAILAPIPGENPAGEDLRYNPVYEDIKEARRADDPLDRGAWQHEIKTSDWDKVIKVASDALIKKTKDLQIAAWLSEALIITEGFEGFAAGLKIINGFMRDLWDHVYPVIEDGDMDFRAAPLEFMNEKVSPLIKGIPVTDGRAASEYSWLKWQESRSVGYEADTKNQYGDTDDSKKKKRDEMIGEGKITAEDFDSAVAQSSTGFYESLAVNIKVCRDEFTELDKMVDEKFGSHGPRLSELGSFMQDCERLVTKILKDRGGNLPVTEPGEMKNVEQHPAESEVDDAGEKEDKGEEIQSVTSMEVIQDMPVPGFRSAVGPDIMDYEKAAWKEAIKIMKTSGFKKALDQLIAACNSAPSVRERNRYRLLIAKLCLKADRPDLASPIVEELHALIEELHLDRWESPVWIAEVIDALYQCLTKGGSDEDPVRAKTLFQKLCTTDVTKAISYGR